jgi:glutaredoxin
MNKEVITRAGVNGRTLEAAVEAHSRTHDCSMKGFSKTQKVISEEDEVVLKLVKELAAKKNFRFRVIDVTSLNGKLMATLKGVKATPTIIVGNNRFTGVPKREEFEAFLKGHV